MAKAGDPRVTQRWKELRRQVLREEPRCRLCGRRAEEVDHVLSVETNPELAFARSNLQGVCRRCNRSKWIRPGMTCKFHSPVTQSCPHSRDW